MGRRIQWRAWLWGIVAAVVGGAANGVITGFAAIGIDPQHFNLAAGLSHTLKIAGVASGLSALLGLAFFLKQSPLPRGLQPEPRASAASAAPPG